MPTVLSGNIEKSRRTSVSIVCFPDEIRIRYLLDTRLESYRRTNPPRSNIMCSKSTYICAPELEGLLSSSVQIVQVGRNDVKATAQAAK
jgi:hypothetical protein